ncbi:MAG: hypothetical protein ACPLZH_00680 [Minisyncoccales bacterium]
MRYEIIFFIPFFLSLFGLKKIIGQKLKTFSLLEEREGQFYFFEKLKLILEKLKTKIKDFHPLKNYSFLLFLEKNLKKVSIFFLRLYNQITKINQAVLFYLKKIKKSKKEE